MIEIERIVTNLGFPIAMCIAIIWYIKDFIDNTIEQIRLDTKEDKQILLDEIKHNRKVNEKLLMTNEVLAKEITVKIDKIGEKIDKFYLDIDK
ncbi:hypothetical protein GCM10008904_10090 [Paraclostridium ghonii]|uniref:Phosphotransacetylase n=1 Tax=Paraclostridium ghonii TaxID=29358 RepID=A0ABU0MYG4_9FIRM|nr:hypothetical protein [Paeniclostridium ghonii]MDQ0555962.1 phosphotransacetylase [Paeniclostridium ghonii]